MEAAQSVELSKEQLEALLQITLDMNHAVYALLTEPESPLATHDACRIFLRHAAQTVLDRFPGGD